MRHLLTLKVGRQLSSLLVYWEYFNFFRLCSCACVSWEFALQVEAKIFELQEAMADRGYSDIEIEEKVAKS